jgi:Ser-tRNA(Ala) deacylase AlaX
MAETVRCGELACQKDSYLRSLPSVKVVSCKPRVAAPAPAPKGKADKKKGPADTVQQLFDVVLADTVLFPEGGGQPSDRGTVGGVNVIAVENVDGIATHVLSGPVTEGSEVCVEVDWMRRWDLCTQHSTQHLVTALATKAWGIETVSWNLGEQTSFLELQTTSLTSEQVTELEKLSNDAIREGHAVKPSWHSVSDVNEGNVPGLRKSAKALPESVLGPGEWRSWTR